MTTQTHGVERSDEDGDALPAGTHLGEFELTKKLGEGGFSIVYLAHDHTLGRLVALKEYMPSSIASRKGHTQVNPRSERHRETFEAGLKSFINEAQLLAKYDHASLVKVHRFWQANGTAYMVMPFYEGVTLRDTVQALGQPPDEAWLIRLLASLTEALVVIHADQCYHRDIAPDNVILLARTGKPLLLDFGAARRVISDMTQALTVILKPGYAPVEQYAEVPDMKQGPWTDVYALAATVYWCITGKPPPPAMGRMLSDNLAPLAECAAGRYSPAFLEAVDRALVVHPAQRTRTIEAFRQDLGLDDADGHPLPLADVPRTIVPGPRMATLPPRAAVTATTGGVPRAAAQSVAPGGQAPAGQPMVAPASGAKLWMAVAGLVTVVTIGVLAWWMQKAPDHAPGTVSNAASSPVLAPVPAPAPPPAAVVPTLPPVTATTAPPPASASMAPEPVAPAAEPARAQVPEPAVQTASPPPDISAPHAPKLRQLRQARERERVQDDAKPRPAARAATTRSKAHEAECATILQRISLGEASPELMSQLKQLHCN